MPTLLETLASYVPALIVRQVNEQSGGAPGPSEKSSRAVALFSDISGFTALTERLARRGPTGVEQLTEVLNDYFGTLIELITSHGGDVVKFAGDALIALWPAGDSVAALAQETRRVAECCLAIQEKLRDYTAPDDIRLSLKLAVGAGEVKTEILGGVFERWELLVLGDPLTQVGAAGHDARPGDTILSPQAWKLVGKSCAGEALEDGAVLPAILGSYRDASTRPPQRTRSA